MSEEPKQEGKLASAASALKKLLAEDPLLFIITVTCLIPIGAAIVTNAFAMQWEFVIGLIFVESGIIVFVTIPLIVTKTWKTSQNRITEERLTQVQTISNERILETKQRLSNDTEAQRRFNQLMDAKIATLKATQDFILSQSERHERRLLKETAKELGEQLTKGFSFVEKDDCRIEVSKILDEINKVHIDYDTAMESINRLKKALEVEKEKVIKVNVVDVVSDPDETKSVEAVGSDPELSPELHITSTSMGANDIAATDSSAELEEALDELSKDIDEIEEEKKEKLDKIFSEEAPNYWVCAKCERENILKAPRCQGCGLGRAASDQIHRKRADVSESG